MMIVTTLPRTPLDSMCVFFFFSSRRRHTRCGRDWSSDVCSSDLLPIGHLDGLLKVCVIDIANGGDCHLRLTTKIAHIPAALAAAADYTDDNLLVSTQHSAREGTYRQRHTRSDRGNRSILDEISSAYAHGTPPTGSSLQKSGLQIHAREEAAAIAWPALRPEFARNLEQLWRCWHRCLLSRAPWPKQSPRRPSSEKIRSPRFPADVPSPCKKLDLCPAGAPRLSGKEASDKALLSSRRYPPSESRAYPE